jgi:tetratricopeptide (TPR) repeat protein
MTWQEHHQKGSLALAQEDYAVAQSELTLAVQEAKTHMNDKSKLGSLYGLLAQSFFRHLDFDQAEPLLKQAIELESTDSTESAWSSRTRDLISLAEILRVKGATTEALDCLENALSGLPVVKQNGSAAYNFVNGVTEFNAMRSLLTQAQDKQQQPSAALETQSTELTQLEQEYCQLLESAKNIVTSDSTSRADLVQTLVRLTKFSTKLELFEHSERYLDLACSIAFGPCYAKQLSIPDDTSHVPSTVVTDLLMTKTNFLSCVFDYAAAARCLADLIKWVEKQNDANLLSKAEMSRLVAPFAGLMQKADLYASSRILTKQALEFEELGEIPRALSIYEKVLSILTQLFPAHHLEICQIMEFQAAALELANRPTEAQTLRDTASAMEDYNVAEGTRVEERDARMPQLKL